MGSRRRKPRRRSARRGLPRTPPRAGAQGGETRQKEGGGGGGEGIGADGAVARVRVSPVPPGSDVAAIAAFLGVDASKVVVLSGEATAIMPDAALRRPRRRRSTRRSSQGALRARRPRRLQARGRRRRGRERAKATSDERADAHARHRRARRRDRRGGGVRRPDRPHHRQGRVEDSRDRRAHRDAILRVRQEEGVCEVSGRDVNAAVQEIKNIVQEGRERREGATGGI